MKNNPSYDRVRIVEDTVGAESLRVERDEAEEWYYVRDFPVFGRAAERRSAC